MKLGDREVRDFGVPYIVAEIGANHNGDMDLAKKIIEAAKSCGCDAVKFQSWTPESLIAKEEYKRNENYGDSSTGHVDSLRDMVEKYYLRPEQHIELKSFCDRVGITFFSTPFSIEESDFLEEIGVPFYKIASMDINNLSLLRHVAQKRKPMVVSTGMATLAEIENAVKTIEHEGNNQIILLHCVSIYPPQDQDVHLNNIIMLRQTFGFPVGFSDHTIGVSIPLASVALGSCLIEKHFTLDKNLPGWDHVISANPEEMKLIVDGSKSIAGALGNFSRSVSAAEEEKKLRFRRSIVTRKPLKKGHVITSVDLAFKRPGTGIRPDEMKYVIGRVLNQDVDHDVLLSWNMLD